MVAEVIAVLILAVVQGITEWLPISSSGHLVLIEHLLGYEGGLLFEVALHFGTLMAVFVYFGKDIVDILRDVTSLKFRSEHGRLGFLIAVASIPIALVGFLFLEFLEPLFSNLTITMLGFAITGLMLLIASTSGTEEVVGCGNKEGKQLPSVWDALLIGVAQMIAVVPGISRAGATMSTGILRGLDAKNAARFSFLMAVPVVFGTNIVMIGNQHLPPEFIGATLLAFIVGLAVMHFMFRVVLTSKRNLQWFGIYALALAAVLAASNAFF